MLPKHKLLERSRTALKTGANLTRFITKETVSAPFYGAILATNIGKTILERTGLKSKQLDPNNPIDLFELAKRDVAAHPPRTAIQAKRQLETLFKSGRKADGARLRPRTWTAVLNDLKRFQLSILPMEDLKGRTAAIVAGQEVTAEIYEQVAELDSGIDKLDTVTMQYPESDKGSS